MALKKCRDCGQKISKKAVTCPNCGAPAKSKGLSAWWMVGALVLGVWLLGSLDGGDSTGVPDTSSSAGQAEIQARVRANLQKELDTNRAGVLSEINNLIAEGDFDLAFRRANRFRDFEDPELQQLAIDAKARFNEAEEQRLVAELRSIPASDFQANIDGYEQVVALAPNNEAYKEKLRHYRSKLADAQQAKREAEEEKRRQEAARVAEIERVHREREAKFGPAPVMSAWDGSYLEVETYLERVANDPDSIEIDDCTSVYFTEDGWLVGCNYRGRNAFGGMIRQAHWFTVRNGAVIQQHEADAYSPDG